MSERQSFSNFLKLIELIADNKFVLGDRLVEVGFSGPNLEATLAVVAMAQGELGHARTLYNWTAKLQDKPIRDMQSQTGKALPGLVKIDNWFELIAGLYTATIAHDLLIRSILRAQAEEAATRVHKLVEEQNEHLVYAREWAKQLLQEKGSIPSTFLKALSAVSREVTDWLRAVDQDTDLQAGNYLDKAPLEEQFNQAVNRTLEDQGVASHAGIH